MPVLSVHKTPFFVLLTADCVVDIVVLNAVISKMAPSFRELWVQDNRELLRYLLRQGQYADRLTFPEPDLVLFSDENSPVCCFRLLRLAKRYKLSDRIPFVLLSGSADDAEKRMAADMGAKLFVEQPVSVRKFSHQLAELKSALGLAA